MNYTHTLIHSYTHTYNIHIHSYIYRTAGKISKKFFLPFNVFFFVVRLYAALLSDI